VTRARQAVRVKTPEDPPGRSPGDAAGGSSKKGPPMRVLIVDDHPVTRDGLRAALTTSDEVEIVGEATSGEEAVDAAKDLEPDVVFMDVRMPGMGGLEATREIRQNRPDTRVILFTVEESRSAVADAIRAGVSGYLLKDVSAGELIQAARLARQGKLMIHPTLTRAFIEEAAYVEQRQDTPLSRRESEILQKVAYGATTKEVAHDLGISPHTVKTHLERIFEKLGANDRAQAVAIALRRGLVE
jgi:two-component system, NarL family, response regulator DegU